jgi:hypothetical protein
MLLQYVQAMFLRIVVVARAPFQGANISTIRAKRTTPQQMLLPVQQIQPNQEPVEITLSPAQSDELQTMFVGSHHPQLRSRTNLRTVRPKIPVVKISRRAAQIETRAATPSGPIRGQTKYNPCDNDRFGSRFIVS